MRRLRCFGVFAPQHDDDFNSALRMTGHFCAARRLSPAISASVRTCAAISSWIFIQASVSSCKRSALRATTREAGPRASRVVARNALRLQEETLARTEEHTSELQSRLKLVCRLL